MGIDVERFSSGTGTMPRIGDGMMAERSERPEHGETTLNAMNANAMPLVDPTSKTRIDDRNIMDRKVRVFIFLSAIFLSLAFSPTFAAESGKDLPVCRLGNEPHSFTSEADTSGSFTWWFPEKADALILPISAGIQVETTNGPLMRWLREASPWDLSKLPIIGVRYGERTAVGIVPWPHDAELVVEHRVGVRFKFPPGRSNATPCDVAAKAAGLGYLTGPYDSYHSVHNPKAAPDATWETAQFDQAAFAHGRVQNADGSGHGGFKNQGYHLSPAGAWPYVRSRVNRVLD